MQFMIFFVKWIEVLISKVKKVVVLVFVEGKLFECFMQEDFDIVLVVFLGMVEELKFAVEEKQVEWVNDMEKEMVDVIEKGLSGDEYLVELVLVVIDLWKIFCVKKILMIRKLEVFVAVVEYYVNSIFLNGVFVF